MTTIYTAISGGYTFLTFLTTVTHQWSTIRKWLLIWVLTSKDLIFLCSLILFKLLPHAHAFQCFLFDRKPCCKCTKSECISVFLLMWCQAFAWPLAGEDTCTLNFCLSLKRESIPFLILLLVWLARYSDHMLLLCYSTRQNKAQWYFQRLQTEVKQTNVYYKHHLLPMASQANIQANQCIPHAMGQKNKCTCLNIAMFTQGLLAYDFK